MALYVGVAMGQVWIGLGTITYETLTRAWPDLTSGQNLSAHTHPQVILGHPFNPDIIYFAGFDP